VRKRAARIAPGGFFFALRLGEPAMAFDEGD